MSNEIERSFEDTGNEDVGGVGDISGQHFFWIRKGNTETLEAAFLDGNCLEFPNTKEGWTDFMGWAYIVAGVFGPHLPGLNKE